jgi:hypothetical protein
MDRSQGHFDGAAEELRRKGHHHEAALESFAGSGSHLIQRRIDQPFRRLAFLKAQPAGADVGEIEQEGGTSDFQIVAAFRADKPLALNRSRGRELADRKVINS